MVERYLVKKYLTNDYKQLSKQRAEAIALQNLDFEIIAYLKNELKEGNIDFIKYSLVDESIDVFISKLNCLDGIKISRLGKIEELKISLLEAVNHRAKDGWEAERNRNFGLPVSESMATIGG